MADFITNDQVVLAARRALSQANWDYLVGASESETTMRRNRLAFDHWGFRPRVLVDVSHVDHETTLLGHKLRLPVLLAPVGSLQLFDPDGAAASARAAASFGTLQVLSSVSQPELEVVAAAAEAPRIFQLYIRGDLPWCQEMIARAEAAGYVGLCITVDTAVSSRRERAMLSRFVSPSSRYRTPTPGGPNYASMVTWDTLEALKGMTKLPLLLKGVATADDAALAVQHGVDVVWVSNHGGRQLDHGLGTLDTLPEVVEAVAGRAQIILDGGIQRGSDIVKAIALGATAVAIGKLQAWGLAAGGVDGIIKVLEILENEVEVAMGLLGVTRLDQLSPKYVCRADAVTPSNEMGMWPAFADGRVL